MKISSLTVKIRKSRWFTKPIGFGLATAILLAVGFQNCSGNFFAAPKDDKSVSSPSLIDDANSNAIPRAPTQDAKVVGVVHSENLLSQMQNLAGVQQMGLMPKISNTSSLDRVRSQLGMVPVKGTADSVTAPMWLAVTSVAGEVCGELVLQESTPANLRIFKGVDFTKGPNAITDSVKKDIIRNMARSFWSRNETTDELNMILSDLNTQFPSSLTTAAATKSAMIYLCTAMLSAPDAQIQ